MKNGIRSRNRAAVAFLVSLAVFVPALVIPRSAENLIVRTMLLVLSLGATLISLVWFLVRWDEAKRLTRLRSGAGILARWTIDPARWEWFRHHSSEWDKRKGVRPNNADLAQAPGSIGVEIVVSGDGILIGEDFQPLEKNVTITVHADWMEFYQVIPKPRGPALHIVLRLPLEPGKESLAAQVQQAYKAAYGVALSGSRGKLYVLLLIFVGLPLVTVLIWFIGRSTGWME
jgi:hypothetical protein